MDKEELYMEHQREMFGAESIDKYSETDVNRLLDRLLLCLPNNGKLYKYRSFSDYEKAFEYTYDALRNGYIWMARADTLNDDADSTVKYDAEKELIKTKDYLLANPVLLMNAIYKNAQGGILFGQNQFDDFMFGKVIDCFNRDTGELIDSKAIESIMQYGFSYTKAVDYLSQVKDFIQQAITENQEALEELADNYRQFNQKCREMTYVFSMSDSYSNDALWAYYADNNGFCIEYDFHYAKRLPLDLKRKLVSLYRVTYATELPEYSFVDMLTYIMTGKKDKTLLKKANWDLLTQAITKKKIWENESEWRIFLCNIENKLFADIVSAIYIDERSLNNVNGKKLIELCSEKGWPIHVRKRNETNTGHIFERYNLSEVNK